MKIKFDKIHIFTNDGEESIIYISSSLTFIYGNIGVGKSTLLNLIFFAMGGKLIPTPAVEQCLRAIQIDVFLGEGKFLLFRQKNSTNILVENVLEKQKFTVPSVKM